MNKKEKAIQKALGTLPFVYKTTPKGIKRIVHVFNTQNNPTFGDWRKVNTLLEYILLSNLRGGYFDCTSKTEFLYYLKCVGMPPRHLNCMSKRWDVCLKEKLITEVQRKSTKQSNWAHLFYPRYQLNMRLINR